MAANRTDASTFLERVSEALLAFDPEWRLVFANDAAAALLGRPAAMPADADGRALLREALGPAVEVSVGRALAERIPTRLEVVDPARDRRLEVRVYPAADGFSILLFDISERKRAEERMRQDEQRFRRLVEHAGEMLSLLDADGIMRYKNAATRHVLGWAPDELIGHHFGELVHPEDRERVLAVFSRRTQVPGASATVEFRCRHKDGSWRMLESTGRNELDRIGGVLVASRDVTEQRLLGEQLRLAHRMESVGLLASGIAHDFNNLLTVIRSGTDLLLADLPPDDPRRSDLQDVQGAADRAAALTGQLLAFSRREAGESRITSINEVLSAMVMLLARLLPGHIRLATMLDAEDPLVEIEAAQLERVILNLAVNARDAMPYGGALTMRTETYVSIPDDSAGVGLDAESGWVSLTVSDTGSGMDDATLVRIFEPFFTTKEAGRGTGLGLATVYGIVKQSGGRVTVQSAPGAGSTFRIFLPRRREETTATTPAAAPTRRPRAAAAAPATILVVDDEAAVRRVASRVLTRSGYTVLLAENGVDALSQIENHPAEIDLLLTDLVMPQMSGRELIERASPLRPGMRLLLMSGYTDDPIVRSALEDASLAFLPKPFTVEELLEGVDRVLRM